MLVDMIAKNTAGYFNTSISQFHTLLTHGMLDGVVVIIRAINFRTMLRLQNILEIKKFSI